MLQAFGVGEITALDKPGILSDSVEYPHQHWREIAAITNQLQLRGGITEAIRGADVFIGLSVGGIVSEEMVRSMTSNAIVFALANPEPEIAPDRAIAAGAAIAASGRFDFPNHCNNVLAFPGLMHGALETRALKVSAAMCLAASQALAGLVTVDTLSSSKILPSPFDPEVHAAVAEATAMAVISEALVRIKVESDAVRVGTLERVQLLRRRQSSLS
jgi:malate dehydrogenase (oxaloacetate-decarboxylating)